MKSVGFMTVVKDEVLLWRRPGTHQLLALDCIKLFAKTKICQINILGHLETDF